MIIRHCIKSPFRQNVLFRRFYISLSKSHAAQLLADYGAKSIFQATENSKSNYEPVVAPRRPSGSADQLTKSDIAQDEAIYKLNISRELKSPQVVIIHPGASTKSIPICYSDELLADQIIKSIATSLQLQNAPTQYLQLKTAVNALWAAFKHYDAEAIHFRILNIRQNLRIVIEAMRVDPDAIKRQPEWANMPFTDVRTQYEKQAEADGLIYMDLDPAGNVGCIVNGAGLSMATNDIIDHLGGRSANFLDTGGQATTDLLVRAFDLIISKPNVKAILVNIFGGVIRCDMIAESIIRAANELNMDGIPIVVRLRGTNQEEGQRMIRESGLALHAIDQVDKAASKVIELARTSTRRSTTKINKRHFSSARRLAESDHDRRIRLSNLDINESTKLVYQGFTGSVATANAKATMAYGTKVIGGTSPTKGGTTHLDKPVYKSLTDLCAAGHKPDATAIFVPALHAKHAIEEAIQNNIPLIISVSEGLPVHDLLSIHATLASQKGIRSRLIGPNSPGIIHPPSRVRIGIMPPSQFRAGRVSIISKSGTLSYESVAETSRVGVGQDLVVGVGGDQLPGTSMADALSLVLKRPGTEGVVLIGEIGGTMEFDAAKVVEAYYDGGGEKPIVGMVVGRMAPVGRVMGHAGAFREEGDPTASDKIRALEEAGVVICQHTAQIGTTIAGLLEKK